MKKLLLVIDFQYDFIEGTLGFPKAKDLVPLIKEKIIQARQSGYQIGFTFDTHDQTYLKTQEGKKLPIVHCIPGTKGYDLPQAIIDVKHDEDLVFTKHTFGSLDLASFLQDNYYDVIEIVGLVTNICVISNAIIAKAASPETDIKIYRHLVASFDYDLHEKSLHVLSGMQFEIID